MCAIYKLSGLRQGCYEKQIGLCTKEHGMVLATDYLTDVPGVIIIIEVFVGTPCHGHLWKEIQFSSVPRLLSYMPRPTSEVRLRELRQERQVMWVKPEMVELHLQLQKEKEHI